ILSLCVRNWRSKTANVAKLKSKKSSASRAPKSPNSSISISINGARSCVAPWQKPESAKTCFRLRSASRPTKPPSSRAMNSPESFWKAWADEMGLNQIQDQNRDLDLDPSHTSLGQMWTLTLRSQSLLQEKQSPSQRVGSMLSLRKWAQMKSARNTTGITEQSISIWSIPASQSSGTHEGPFASRRSELHAHGL